MEAFRGKPAFDQRLDADLGFLLAEGRMVMPEHADRNG
jgi:hypothetical protein